MKTDEKQEKMSCTDQLLLLRNFYDTLASDICGCLKMSRRMLNYKIANDSFSIAESVMINSIITDKTQKLCA